MDERLFESSSGDIEFLIFQDRLNSLYRFLEIIKIPIQDYINRYKAENRERSESIEKGPEYYESELEGYGKWEFTKHEMLMALEFDDNSSGIDSTYFTQYFYSSILILGMSILEGLLRELADRTANKSNNNFNPNKDSNEIFVIRVLNYLNKNGYNCSLGQDDLKTYKLMNSVRTHVVHNLNKEYATVGEIENMKIDYEFVLKSLKTVASIAELLEKN